MQNLRYWKNYGMGVANSLAKSVVDVAEIGSDIEYGLDKILLGSEKAKENKDKNEDMYYDINKKIDDVTRKYIDTGDNYYIDQSAFSEGQTLGDVIPYIAGIGAIVKNGLKTAIKETPKINKFAKQGLDAIISKTRKTTYKPKNVFVKPK